jgi:hypothetical protein
MWLVTKNGKRQYQIDDEDWPRVNQHAWSVGQKKYLRARISGHFVSLHVFIMGPAPDGLIWDHKNRDKYDNRKENLRPVTQAVNQRNRDLRRCNTTGVNGVDFNGYRWRVRIRFNKAKQITIGYFDSLEEARQARLKAEEQYWGNER